MAAPFKRLSIAEFALLLERFPFSRRITSVHMHHTWRPNHAQFRGHDSIVSMWRFHTEERHFSDIAQHLTIAPDGSLWTGRNWNSPPASAVGFNGNSTSGPFMFEIVGDFDRGMDPLVGAQRAATLDVIKLVQAKFGLVPETLMFHNQMAKKSCPGTAIVRNDFIKELHEHKLSTTTASRGVERGPFGADALASNDAVAQAIALLIDPIPTGRSTDPPDAELHYGEESRSALVTEAASRAGSDELSADALELLRPHIVNLRMGRFSSEGKMTTTAGDVDALFEQHLPHWMASRQGTNAPARVMFYAHGGLVSESSGLGAASRSRDWWLRNGVYPIYFIWETGLFQTIGDLLLKVRGKAIPAGGRDIADWTTDPLIEEGVRALQAQRIWGGMKASAALANDPDGGARYVTERLGEFLKDNGGKVELHAVGHSAGSIFHAHFLPACKVAAASFKTLQLLAPAVTCEDYKVYLDSMLRADGVIPHTTIFTMNRTNERADDCARIYRKSLLYLVSEACESKRKTPILGLEDSLRADARLKAMFGLGIKASSDGEIVWSKSSSTDGRSASQSTSHGGFDDDAPTMNSVLRRVLDLQDADAVIPFPVSTRSRGSARDWSSEVDWPEAFDRPPEIELPPAALVSAQASSSASPGLPVADVASITSKGRRKAVCIGINAYPTAPLNGCVADATQWQATLQGLGFETTLVTNEGATRERILGELSSLIAGSRAGDALVFQYAGHGTQVEDLNGDEKGLDPPDEAICPVDFASGALLIDDDIAEQVALLPVGVQLSFLLDCCHSGTGTRFAARVVSAPPLGGLAKARYIVATPELRASHRAFRAKWRTPADASRGLAKSAGTSVAMREVTFAACKAEEVAWEVDGQGEFTRRSHEVLAAAAAGLTNVAFHEAVLRAFGSNARQQPQLDCDVSLRSARWLGV